MNDTLGMRRGQHIEQLSGNPQGFTDGNLLVRGKPKGFYTGAVEQLHEQKGRPGFVLVVVEDPHHPLVVDRVRGASLSDETLANTLLRGQLRMQQLQREPLAVLVRYGEDSRHPPDTEHAVNGKLPAQDGSDPRLGPG